METYTETADVTSNLGSDLELSVSTECELQTSEVERETELEIRIQRRLFRTRRSLHRQAACR